MNKSKIIVIEGTDGSGKATQTKLLMEHLEKEGFKVFTTSFPKYESDSSALVKMYLNGEIAENANGVNAKAASMFYAADRYATLSYSTPSLPTAFPFAAILNSSYSSAKEYVSSAYTMSVSSLCNSLFTVSISATSATSTDSTATSVALTFVAGTEEITNATESIIEIIFFFCKHNVFLHKVYS